MERIEREKNLKVSKIVRWIILLAVILVTVYGYTRIPYFVVRQNLMLQYNFDYKDYDEVIEKRRKYLEDDFFSELTTSNSVIEQRQLLKGKKVICKLLFLEIGMRNAEGEVPYTVIHSCLLPDEEEIHFGYSHE